MNNWYKKFACAGEGVLGAALTQNSFAVHCFFVVAVVAVGGSLHIDAWRWVAVTVAITIVMVAELFNTAIEEMVQTLHPEKDERIGRVLDISAGAVLIAAIGSVVVGLLTLGPPLLEAFGMM